MGSLSLLSTPSTLLTMPARITIVMGVLPLAIAVVEFYFAYDSAESNTLNSWDDRSTKNMAIAMTNTGQFGTGCQMLGSPSWCSHFTNPPSFWTTTKLTSFPALRHAPPDVESQNNFTIDSNVTHGIKVVDDMCSRERS